MAEFSDDEMVMMENAYEETLNLIKQMEPTPETEALAQQVVEAQQIVSSKIEGSGSGKEMISEASPSGPGV
jgi:hypothetical protein